MTVTAQILVKQGWLTKEEIKDKETKVCYNKYSRPLSGPTPTLHTFSI